MNPRTVVADNARALEAGNARGYGNSCMRRSKWAILRPVGFDHPGVSVVMRVRPVGDAIRLVASHRFFLGPFGEEELPQSVSALRAVADLDW
jgi:hypothetical protein